MLAVYSVNLTVVTQPTVLANNVPIGTITQVGQLTNGNLVIIFSSTLGLSFTIVTESGVPVVSPTVIYSTADTSCALCIHQAGSPGDGYFAARGTKGIAVYNNNGVLQGSVLSIPSLLTSTSGMDILSDGSSFFFFASSVSGSVSTQLQKLTISGAITGYTVSDYFKYLQFWFHHHKWYGRDHFSLFT